MTLDARYLAESQRDPDIAETGRDYWMAEPERYWERIGAVDMVPGRLLIFPSEFYHAAYHPKIRSELCLAAQR